MKRFFSDIYYTMTISEKRSYVIKTLDALEGTWPLASGIKLIVNSPQSDDKLLNGVLHIFDYMITQVKNKHQRKRFEQGRNFLKKVKAVTEKNQVKEKDLQEMLKHI